MGLEEGRFVASTPLDADAGGGNEISGEDGDGPELPATLTDDQVDDILVPLRLAMESKSPKVIRAALASLQRLDRVSVKWSRMSCAKSSSSISSIASATKDRVKRSTALASGTPRERR